jgi:ABC-type Fe3+ transport system permease subunit
MEALLTNFKFQSIQHGYGLMVEALFKLPYSILFIRHHVRSKMGQFIEAANILGNCHITLTEIHEFPSLRISKYLGKILLEKLFLKSWLRDCFLIA